MTVPESCAPCQSAAWLQGNRQSRVSGLEASDGSKNRLRQRVLFEFFVGVANCEGMANAS